MGKCYKCGKEVKKPLPKEYHLPKNKLKKYGYDGAEMIYRGGWIILCLKDLKDVFWGEKE